MSELRSTNFEPSKVFVLKVVASQARLNLGLVDLEARKLVTNSSGTGVDDSPYGTVIVYGELKEMVSTAERSHLGPCRFPLTLFQGRAWLVASKPSIHLAHEVARTLVRIMSLTDTGRNGNFQLRKHWGQVCGKIRFDKICLGCDNTAADINPYAGRHNTALGRHNASYDSAKPDMSVWHDSDWHGNNRNPRHLLSL